MGLDTRLYLEYYVYNSRYRRVICMEALMPSLPTLLVLRSLEQGPQHGYRIARWIEEQSTGTLAMKEGTLYPLLHQLERKGLIMGDWQKVNSERPARVYALTEDGRGHLKHEREEWGARAEIVRKVLLGGEVAHGLV